MVEPRFRTPDRPSKLDPYADRLSAWLRREMTRPRKQKRTIKQLHADLVSLGYDGSYGRVAAFARAWQDDYRIQQQTSGRGTFVPLSFAPGEAFQFDWSEDGCGAPLRNSCVSGCCRVRLSVRTDPEGPSRSLRKDLLPVMIGLLVETGVPRHMACGAINTD